MDRLMELFERRNAAAFDAAHAKLVIDQLGERYPRGDCPTMRFWMNRIDALIKRAGRLHRAYLHQLDHDSKIKGFGDAG